MPSRVWLSAVTGAGVDLLLGAIAEYLHRDVVRGTVRLSVSQARLRALLYEHGAVRTERTNADGGWEIDVEIDRAGFSDLNLGAEDILIRAPDETMIPAPARLQ